MNARDKAQAAKLRRVPDSAFAREAQSRGFRRFKAHGPIEMPVDLMQEMVRDLHSAILTMAKGGDGHAIYALRAMGGVINKLEHKIFSYELLVEAIEEEAAQ